MLKRTKGRFLLTLLVITGLAGTLRNTTLTSAERKLAISELKKGKETLMQSVRGLSAAQLNFRPAAGQPTIGESISRMVQTEKQLWKQLQTAMKVTAPCRAEHTITDGEILRNNSLCTPKPGLPATTGQTVTETMAAFKSLRAEQIKYVRSTTEDLRDHVLPLSAGHADAYQFLLFIAAQSHQYARQINEIKAAPGFPHQ